MSVKNLLRSTLLFRDKALTRILWKIQLVILILLARYLKH